MARAAMTTRTRKSRRRIILPILAIACVAIAAVGFSSFLITNLARPSIVRLDPILVEPGGIIRIEGRNFGLERGDSRVEIDGVAPTASSYLGWAPSSLMLRLPASADSGLVYVVTPKGRSNPKLFMNRANLPVRAKIESGGGSGPYLASLSATKGPIGSVVSLSGRSFGSNRGGGAVLFSWSSEDRSGALDSRSEIFYSQNAEGDLGYELWSDKEIRVRVPDGAISGAVSVRSSGGVSNSLFFDVTETPGYKRFTDRRSYALSYSVSIADVRASLPNELYLWVPRPSESASQRMARTLAQDPTPLVPDFRGVSLYRFKDLTEAQEASVSQSFLVQTWAVETKVEPESIRVPQNPPPLMAAYLLPDEFVPSAAPEILAMAKRISSGERNPYRAARLVYEYVTRNLAWTDAKEVKKPLAALAAKTADSSSYAILVCALLRASGVPALPVSGFLVDPNRQTVRHAWIEFYIYGLGWVPMDPILGSGVKPGGLTPAFEELGRYFGSVDNRRVAFSRGYVVLAPMAPSGRRSSPARPLAFQSFYEESSGSLDAYSSFWSDVEVTGLY